MTDHLRQKPNPTSAARDIAGIFATPAEQQAALHGFARAAAACGAQVALLGVAYPGHEQVADAAAPLIGPPVAPGEPPEAAGLALRRLKAAAEAQGYSALWAAAPGPNPALAAAARAEGVPVLCLYDAALLPGEQLLAALQAHPWVLIDGEISENELYLPPAGGGRFAAVYERMQARRAERRAERLREQAAPPVTPDAVALIDIAGGQPPRLVDLNGSVGGVTPYDLFEDRDRLRRVTPGDRPAVAQFFERVLNGENAEVEFCLNAEEGQGCDTWVRLLGRGQPSNGRGAGGEAGSGPVSGPGHWSGMRLYLAARDIDWRKRAERELSASSAALGAAVEQLNQANAMLREKQRQLDLLLSQSPVQIWTTGPDLTFTSAVGAEARAGAFLPADVVGKPAGQFFLPDTPLYESHLAALDGSSSSIQASAGGRSYLARVEPLRDAQGAAAGVIGVALDVTEQQQAEEALLLTQAFNRKLLDASLDSLVLLDRKGCILALNDTSAAFFGRSVDALVGQPLADLLTPVVGQTLLNDLSSVITGRKTVEHSFEDGERVLRLRMDPIFDPQGGVAQVALLVQDISPFLEAEQDERRRREVAEILRSVSEDLTRSTNRKEVLRVVLEGVRWLAPDISAHVLMLKEGLAFIECFHHHAAVRGLGDVRYMPPLPVEVTADLRSMYKTQQPVIIGDVLQDPDWVKTEAMRWVRSYAGAPIVIGAAVVGFICLYSETPQALNRQHVELIQALAGQAAVALQKAQMLTDLEEMNEALSAAYVQLAEKNDALAATYSQLEDRNQALSAAYDATIAGWARALELRDKETEGHSQRVVALTMQLAERMGVPDGEHDAMRWGALLHDIGKMGIPDHILLKADQPLTDQEWLVMKLHPSLAHDMLSGIEYLRPALAIPYAHHEWWDGSGYPLGLRGADIPLAARIFSVVDAWDALTNQRPYRPAWSPWRVARHIRSMAGRQFDPQVVDVFLSMMGYE